MPPGDSMMHDLDDTWESKDDVMCERNLVLEFCDAALARCSAQI